jgi:hypothetical protein
MKTSPNSWHAVMHERSGRFEPGTFLSAELLMKYPG